MHIEHVRGRGVEEVVISLALNPLRLKFLPENTNLADKLTGIVLVSALSSESRKNLKGTWADRLTNAPEAAGQIKATKKAGANSHRPLVACHLPPVHPWSTCKRWRRHATR